MNNTSGLHLNFYAPHYQPEKSFVNIYIMYLNMQYYLYLYTSILYTLYTTPIYYIMLSDAMTSHENFLCVASCTNLKIYVHL